MFFNKIKSINMLYNISKILYKFIPTTFLKWRTQSNDESKHIIYCEKILNILSILLLYSTIIIIFVYYQWKECTNIIDIIENKEKNTTYYTKLFRRNNTFCNILDGFFITYIIILIFTLFLNIFLGILYYYYRLHKNNQFNKNKENILQDKKIIIHIPLYNEDYSTIKSTIDSIAKSNYEKHNLLLMIVLDGIIYDENKTIDNILLNDIFNNQNYINDLNKNTIYENTILYNDNNLKLYNGIYDDIAYITILKCGNENEINNKKRGNRGKKDSALIIYNTIEFLYNGYFNGEFHISYTNIINYIQHSLLYKEHNIIEYEYMLILDCDTDVEKDGILKLINYLDNNTNCIAVCGETIVKNKNTNMITMVQSFEYFISHLLLKTFENIMYNIFVLSGCFTLLKIKKNNKALINKNILLKYTKKGETLYDKNLLDIGEDRYLTSLMIQEYPSNDISYISEAKCYTNVPESNKILLDQRRRWTNSLISCLFLLHSTPPKQNIIKNIKMYFIIYMELFIIFLLPLIIIIGLLNSVISLTIQGFSAIPLFITLLVILLNLIITIFVLRFDMLINFIPFFIHLPIFSIIIPWYSILNLDNLKWGLVTVK